MGVIPFELQQFGFEFGTIYETISFRNDTHTFFLGDIYEKMSDFFLPKKKSAVQWSEWLGGFVVKKFPSG